MELGTLLSCAEPPSIELFHVLQRDHQLLSVSDMDILHRELLSCYHYLRNCLGELTGSAQHNANDPTEYDSHTCIYEFVRKKEAQVDTFEDYLRYTTCRTRFICYLFQRLLETTLGQVAIQEQRCALDILWLQLDNTLWTVSIYHHRGFPDQWFAALATNLRQLGRQIGEWDDQLQIDLS
jgi:hypothetical protein